MAEDKRANDERAFHSAIVESSQDAIIGKSLDGTILSWNSGAQAIYGWSAQEAVGRSISIIVPGDRGDEPWTIIERIQRGERIEAFETLRLCRDGRLVHVSLTVSPVRGANGEIVAAATVERDVTARKRTEEALRESEQRLKDVVASSSDWLWETDDQGRFVYVVDQAGILGRPVSYYLGKTIAEVMAGVVPDPLLERHLADLAARQPFRDFAYWIERPLGRRCCAVSGVPRFAADGSFLGYRGTGADITEHKLAERALHDSEQRLRAVMETAVDGIITIDADGTIDYVNPAVERLFGYSRSELISRNVKVLMPAPDRERHDTYIAQYLTTGQRKVIGIGRDVTGRRKDGSTFPIYLSVGEFQIDGARYFAGILRDITERKQAEDQLKLLLRELEHRVKNILAVVRAIAFQTARQSNTLESFTESFSARVDALASTHDLLIQGQWRSARMSQVVERGLSLYRQRDGHNVETVGEDLAIAPRSAIAFSLILYELATNAAKYGAFSVPGGRVRLEWRVTEDDFALSWSESHGPRVRAPERRGFGSALIGGITEHELGGKAELRFDPKGLRCRIVVPRREVLAPHSPAA